MGTERRREREARQRRETILAAARRLFWEQGFERTTMPRIAAEAELATGTLYLYFPSKEALYLELLAEGYEKLRSALEAAVERPGSVRDRGAALMEAFLGFARKSPEYFDIIFFLLQREGDGGWTGRFPPEQVKGIEARMRACQDVAAGVVREARPRATEREVKVAVDAIWSMLSGTVLYFKDGDDFDEISREATEILLAGLAPAGRSDLRRAERSKDKGKGGGT